MARNAPPVSDPDKALSNLDSDSQAKFLLLRSSKAEQLYARYFLNLDLAPYQVFIVKLMRGVFKKEGEARQFIENEGLEWMYDTGSVHLRSDRSGNLFPNNEILLPGAFGKTTIVRLMLDMEAHDNPNSRTQSIFKNLAEAHAISSVVRQDLQSPKAVELFGDPVPKDGAWSNDRFSLAQRIWSDVRDNFEFYGTNSDAPLGKRSDTVLSDDVETPDTARTSDACEKLIEWFVTGPMTSAKSLWVKDKYGRPQIPRKLDWPDRTYWGHTNLGTIFHPRGLHAYLSNHPSYNYVRLDCFRDKQQKHSLDDRMLTAEELHDKAKGGILIFNKRYRNIAVDPAEMSFQEHWLRGGDTITESGKRVSYNGCLDRDYSYGAYENTWNLYLGFDPATGSATRFAAYSAYVLVGVDPHAEDEVYLIDYLKVQTDYSRMLDILLNGNKEYGLKGFIEMYNLTCITLEKNNHGMMAVGDDRVKPYIQAGLIKPSYTGIQKLDPIVGVPAMASLVENGKLHLPYKTANDQERTENFITDMVEFHPIRDKRDLVMALWLATIPVRDARKQAKAWRSKTVYRSPLSRARARA